MAADFFAGCVGGSVGVLAGHPFDTVKVRMQCQNGSQRYTSTIDCIRSIIKQESAMAMMRGITSPLIGISFRTAIVFGVQGNLQRYMAHPDALYSHLMSGCAAGLVQTIVTSPMELIKTRMQVQGTGKKYNDKSSRIYKSPLHCVKQIYKYEGMKGLGRGFLLTATRDCPGFGVYFVTYEILCGLFSAKEEGGSQEEIGLPGLLLAGGLAGIVSWIPCYPTDVIKSRIQADGMGQTIYKGAIDCTRQSYKAEGFKVFFKGLSPTLIRDFPVNAVTIAVFSTVIHYLRPENGQEDRHRLIHETIPEVIEGVIHI